MAPVNKSHMTPVQIGGAVLLLLGCLVMLGWTFELARVVRVFLDSRAMVFNTALSFSLAGAALLAPMGNKARYARFTTHIGMALIALAGLVLAEHILQADLYVDWRSLHAWMHDGNPRPGRMSAAAATAFLMAGVALILATRVRAQWMATVVRALTVTIGAVGVLAIAGHSISAHLLFPDYALADVSIHAAVAFVLLSATLWSTWRRMEWGNAPLFTREDHRITFVGAATMAAVAFAAGIASFAILQERVQAVVTQAVSLTLTRWVEIFEDHVALHERNASLAATRPELLKNLRFRHAGRDDGSNIENARAVVHSFLNQGFKGIAYYDIDGRLVAGGGSLVDEPEMAVTLATPEKAELLWSGGFILRHRIVLRDAAGQVGSVVTEQPLPTLTRFAAEPLRMAKTAETGLCVQRDARLHCFPNQLNRRVFSAPTVNVNGEPLPMTRALAGQTASIVARDYRAQNVVAAFGPVGKLGPAMVVKVDAADIFSPIRDRLGLTAGLLLALVSGGTLLLRTQLSPLAATLRESREEFRAVTETANDGIVSADAEGRITYVNRAAQAMFGYTPGEMLGQPLTMLMPERLRAQHTAGLQRFVATREPRIIGKTVEIMARAREGGEIPVEISLASRASPRGLFFTAILRDITARKEAAEALRRLNEELEQRVATRTAELNAAITDLRKSEFHYRMLFDANPHPMWVYDQQTLRFLAVNNAATEHYGYASEQFLEMTIAEIRPSADRASLRSLVQSLDARHPNRGVYRHQKKSGELIDVEVISHGIQFSGAAARLVLAHDVTQRKRAEEEIRRLNAQLEDRVRQRTAELEAVNRELEAFSYSVSHDLRAPLRHIGGFSELLEEESAASLSENGRRYLSIIKESVSQMGALIDDLLAFSKMGRSELRRDDVSMDELVSEVVAECKAELKDRRVYWQIGTLPRVQGDRAMLKQVWVNLIGNAVKYTRPRNPASINIGCEVRGGEVEFSVRDNGAGFDMAYADKLFGVFQRLHRPEEFEGTGVGLASVQRIVTRHGGRVRAEGRIDQGATFYFTLPHQGTGE